MHREDLNELEKTCQELKHKANCRAVESDIAPLLDYLRLSQIKQLYRWLNETYKEMNKSRPNNIGIEYLLAVKTYLDNIQSRTGTAYTQ